MKLSISKCKTKVNGVIDSHAKLIDISKEICVSVKISFLNSNKSELPTFFNYKSKKNTLQKTCLHILKFYRNSFFKHIAFYLFNIEANKSPLNSIHYLIARYMFRSIYDIFILLDIYAPVQIVSSSHHYKVKNNNKCVGTSVMSVRFQLL